ncbi:PaaI family thioesterase [Halobacteria archaeon HArc-gm2]|nr:PaaI family thioesterase [Halobacteria archaeon HArc-gm2]
MSLETVFNEIPFVESLGIEVTEAADGHAEGTLPLREEHTTNPHGGVAHGGVTYSLADTVGGAAVVSLTGDVAPTVDMRIDYLAPATADLTATADVVRNGGSVAVANVEIHDADDHHVATARGVYKTGGQNGESPWEADVERDDVDPDDDQ